MEENDSVIAREAIFEVIENQMKENNPPITNETFERLMEEGFSREESMKYIGCALSVELFDMMKNNEKYDESRYANNLKKLPELPWEEE